MAMIRSAVVRGSPCPPSRRRPCEPFLVPLGDAEIRLELHCDWIDTRTAKHWTPREAAAGQAGRQAARARRMAYMCNYNASKMLYS